MSIILQGKKALLGIKDYGKDIYEDTTRGVNNFIDKRHKTLEHYGISSPTNTQLIEALNVFHYHSKLESENASTSKQLIKILTKEHYKLDERKITDLYNKINSSDDPTLTIESLNENEKLTSEELLGLMMYVLCIHFRDTQIKDGNKLSTLRIPKLSKSMPSHPGEKPLKPRLDDFSSIEEYNKALSQRRHAYSQWKRQYKDYNNRSCNIKQGELSLKYLIDLGPLNHTLSGFIKHFFKLISLLCGFGEEDLMQSKYQPNILDMSDEEERELRHIIYDIKDGEKFFVVLNHETFANIPIFIMKIRQVAKKLGIDDINEHLSTVIGTLILTNRKQEGGLNTISAIIPTTPITNEIPGAEPLCEKFRTDATNQIKRELSITNQKYGKMVICAPSGTRDIVYYNNGTPMILIPDESRRSNRATEKIIINNLDPKVHIMVVSTNTTELKKPNIPSGVTSNNDKYNQNATVNMHIQERKIGESITSQLEQGITYPIPTKDEQGNISYERDSLGHLTEILCAQKIPSDVFKYIKKFTKKIEYQTKGLLPQRMLDENGNINGNININLIKEKINEEIVTKFENSAPDIHSYLQQYMETEQYKSSLQLPRRIFKSNGELHSIEQLLKRYQKTPNSSTCILN